MRDYGTCKISIKRMGKNKNGASPTFGHQPDGMHLALDARGLCGQGPAPQSTVIGTRRDYTHFCLVK